MAPPDAGRDNFAGPPAAGSPEDWPPDYREVLIDRIRRIQRLRARPMLWEVAKVHYGRGVGGVIDFIEDWLITYDPRRAGTGTPAKVPFILFPKQRELIEFLYLALEMQQGGLIEKSRDMGATWLCCAFTLHCWLFRRFSSIGWGSRTEKLVDRIGDPDSIFEKIRMLIAALPPELLPGAFDPRRHIGYMKIINPNNQSTITGEAGDNIGRGGRKLIYFKDESAHYERAEKIEAALGDNTRVQIDISSVNGLGNVFHRRREAGVEWTPGQPFVADRANIFVLDWADHPEKDDNWFRERRKKAERDGLLHIFAQEVERNYAASIRGTIIKFEWVRAATDAHLKLPWLNWNPNEGQWISGLDVADDGDVGDHNAQTMVRNSVIRSVDEWSLCDVGETTRRAVDNCAKRRVSLNYDGIGIGAGVKGEANRLEAEGLLPPGVDFVPWIASAKPLRADRPFIEDDRQSPLNGELFANFKAQAWWNARLRFERTWKAVTQGVRYSPDQLVSVSSRIPLLHTLTKELCQPVIRKNSSMKMVVDKSPGGTKSPNLGDSAIMALFPADQDAMLPYDAWV